MDPMTILVAIGVATQVCQVVGRQIFESEDAKDGRFLNLLHQGQCPQTKADWQATVTAMTRVQDNAYTRDLSRIFDKCREKAPKDLK